MHTFKPLVFTDYYKVGHVNQYPANTTKVYSNLTARKSRVSGVDSVVSFGFQYYIKEYLINRWNENFFRRSFDEVGKSYLRRVNNSLPDAAVTLDHIKELHNLGYLPLKIKTIPEGSLVGVRVPLLTNTNTADHAGWLVNYLETSLSSSTWQPITSATIAFYFRRLLDGFAERTVGDKSFTPWQGHDFSARGMSSIETSSLSGAGHLLSFNGTDTIWAIDFLEKYYNANSDETLIGGSVPATEHSVASFNIFAILNDKAKMDFYRNEFISRTPKDRQVCEVSELIVAEYAFLKELITVVYPKGIVSYVADTYNIFSVIAEILTRLKPEIMARDGKLVIRPDSFWTDPVDCICGFGGFHPQMNKLSESEKRVVYDGVVESLYKIFGGSKTSKGYITLDPHISCIYGDSINFDRAKEICLRLEKKGFASINSVLGIGSFTYQYNTRDTFGLAVKATYGIVDGKPIEVYKDPVSDDGMKKSATGLLRVDLINGRYVLKDRCTPEEEDGGELKTVFLNGELVKEYSLSEIRERLESFK